LDFEHFHGAVGTLAAHSLPKRLETIAEIMIFDAPILNGEHNDLLKKLNRIWAIDTRSRLLKT
jgi:hypothetical protein